MTAILRDHIDGAFSLLGFTAGGTNQMASQPDGAAGAQLVVGGESRTITNWAAGAAATEDSVTKEAAPTLKQGETLAVAYSVGFSGGTEQNPTIEFNTMFGLKGRNDATYSQIPNHLEEGHVMFGYALFKNNGSNDFTYGTTNFAASSAAGVQYKVFTVREAPSRALWERL